MFSIALQDKVLVCFREENVQTAKAANSPKKIDIFGKATESRVSATEFGKSVVVFKFSQCVKNTSNSE